jgi:hypothetical protein
MCERTSQISARCLRRRHGVDQLPLCGQKRLSPGEKEAFEDWSFYPEWPIRCLRLIDYQQKDIAMAMRAWHTSSHANILRLKGYYVRYCWYH